MKKKIARMLITVLIIALTLSVSAQAMGRQTLPVHKRGA